MDEHRAVRNPPFDWAFVLDQVVNRLGMWVGGLPMSGSRW
jgi:hypothetical protein